MNFINFRKLCTLIMLIAFSLGLSGQEQSATEIKGTIYNASDNAPLNGITVTLPGVASALTDETGVFTLKVPNLKATLIVIGIGYQTIEVPLKGRQEITVYLREADFNSVYDVVKMPYGEKKKNRTSNAVESLDIPEGTTSISIGNELAGRMQGLHAIRQSGSPGMGTHMFVRGMNSLHANNQPLIVVDGMIFENRNDMGSILLGNSPNALSSIDVRDIESVTLIKDGSSLYGTKASNGVLLINTVHPTDAVTKIELFTHAGLKMAPKHMNVMGASAYRGYLTAQLGNSGLSPEEISNLPYMVNDPSASGYNRFNNNTNWQDEVFENSFEESMYARVTGGDEVAMIGLSVGYLNSDGIIKNTGYERYNMRFNADVNVTNRIKFIANLGVGYLINNLLDDGIAPRTGPLYLSLTKAPIFAPYMIGDDGKTLPNFEDYDALDISNPSAIVENMLGEIEDVRFLGTVGTHINLTDRFSFLSTFGIDFDKYSEKVFIPQNGVIPGLLPTGLALNTSKSVADRFYGLYNDSRLGYSSIDGVEHSYGGALGFRYKTNQMESDWGAGYNTPSDEIKDMGKGSALLRRNGGELADWKWLSFYATADYSFRSTYFINANLSMDGSSRFGSEADGISMIGHKFGVFPSVSAAWLVSSESFMASTSLVDVLKVRASYGINGNDDIGYYGDTKYYQSTRFIGVVGFTRANIPNPYLQWETVKKMNIGADIALFNERLSLSADYFKHTTDDMLALAPGSIVSGTDYLLANAGSMENKGYEAGVNLRIIEKELKWDLGLGYSHYENEITSLPEDEMITMVGGAYVISKVGMPIGTFWGYQTNGVFATDEAASASGLQNKPSTGLLENFKGGDMIFADNHVDGIIDEKDRVALGDPHPDFRAMVSSYLTWKGLSLDVLVSISKGGSVYNLLRRQLESADGFANQLTTVGDRWQQQGDQTDMPRATIGDPMGNARFSDRWIEDGSFTRLKNITITYQIPTQKAFFRDVMVYLSGNNLLTFTKYKGFDPEFSYSSSGFYQGIDFGLTPQQKSFFLGLKIGI
jgi:TonB-linked SusC/RagA family outer membrane protein